MQRALLGFPQARPYARLVKSGTARLEDLEEGAMILFMRLFALAGALLLLANGMDLCLFAMDPGSYPFGDAVSGGGRDYLSPWHFVAFRTTGLLLSASILFVGFRGRAWRGALCLLFLLAVTVGFEVFRFSR